MIKMMIKIMIKMMIKMMMPMMIIMMLLRFSCTFLIEAHTAQLVQAGGFCSF